MGYILRRNERNRRIECLVFEIVSWTLTGPVGADNGEIEGLGLG